MSVLTRTGFQPLQFVGCHEHVFTCVRPDAEKHNDSTFFVTHRGADGCPATIYYQVIEVPKEEGPGFATLTSSALRCHIESVMLTGPSPVPRVIYRTILRRQSARSDRYSYLGNGECNKRI